MLISINLSLLLSLGEERVSNSSLFSAPWDSKTICLFSVKSTQIPCPVGMKPPEDPFLPKFSPAIIAPYVGQLLENASRELGALANKNDSNLPRNNNLFNLSPMGSFSPYGRNTREILPLPRLPHCHPFFPLHFSLNLPETQVPISL